MAKKTDKPAAFPYVAQTNIEYAGRNFAIGDGINPDSDTAELLLRQGAIAVPPPPDEDAETTDGAPAAQPATDTATPGGPDVAGA